MIELKEENKTMKKLKMYGKKEGFEGFIATIYVKDGKLVIESEFPEVKKEMEELIITKGIGDDGLPMGRGGATIDVTEEGKLVVTATDPEVEEGLKKEVKVLRKNPEKGFWIVEYEGKEAGTPIHINYIRPFRFPHEPQFFEGLIHSEPLWYEIDPKMPVAKGGLSNILGPRKFGGYEVDEYKSRLIDEKEKE